MESRNALADLFYSGPAHAFNDWANTQVLNVSAGVYTIWDKDHFLYVGMAGKNLSAEDIDAPDEPIKARGLKQRLKSHADGRRSGDQFCVYICDRFVVPSLTTTQQAKIGKGTLKLDALTKEYIHARLTYRYVTTVDGKAALKLERGIQRGEVPELGRPFLNPK